MNHSNIILVVLILFFIPSPGFSQMDIQTDEKWELVKDEGNIQVFTRKPKNSKLKEIRMSIDFDMEVNAFMNVLNNANKYTDWVYKCDESKVLSSLNKQEFYYYVTSDLPFPVSDRDLVVHCKQWTDQDGVIHSTSTAKPDFIPNEKGFVRIEKYQSKWRISPKTDGTIHIDYESISDPGGSIPAWLVNLAVTTGPLKTMKQLEKVVSNPPTLSKK